MGTKQKLKDRAFPLVFNFNFMKNLKSTLKLNLKYKPLSVILARDIYCPECKQLSKSVGNARSILKDGLCENCKNGVRVQHVADDIRSDKVLNLKHKIYGRRN